MPEFSDEFLHKVSAGKVKGASNVYKFGQANVGGNFTAVADDLIYQTPIAPVSLEIVSDNAGDSAVGLGARQMAVSGIGPDYAELTEIVTLNGTTAVPLVNQFLRVYRIAVYNSGTYATAVASSHLGKITVRELGGGAMWGSCNVFGGFGMGSSLIGAFSIPKFHTGHLIRMVLHSETAKAVDIAYFIREGIDQVTAPFTPMKLASLDRSPEGGTVSVPKGLSRELTGPCDIGYMAKTASGAGSATVSVAFDLLLLDRNG
jgi:hypothetical protein